jgi:hypothetical protein
VREFGDASFKDIVKVRDDIFNFVPDWLGAPKMHVTTAHFLA